MLPALVLIAAQLPDRATIEHIALTHAPASAADPASRPTRVPTLSAPAAKAVQRAESACEGRNTRDIIVCGQRGQAYRVDPDVTEGKRQVEANERSAATVTPPAQAICSRQPVGPPPGCGQGLGSLDLANVAIVVGTAALKAAKHQDWKTMFRPGGPDEYELYKEAKRRREALDDQLAAARVRAKAREAERIAHEQSDSSHDQVFVK